MPRISSKNQITLPTRALAEAGLQSGDEVVVDVLEDGELRIRRGSLGFDDAFGALSGVYPAGYLERLDADDERR